MKYFKNFFFAIITMLLFFPYISSKALASPYYRTVHSSHQTVKKNADSNAHPSVLPPPIIKRYITMGPQRDKLIKEYSQIHYGSAFTTIIPQAVVVHWTAGGTVESIYNYFVSVAMSDDEGGSLNVSSQFLVGRDGTIYQLAPDNMLCRHAIGLNWCAIGIENIGGANGQEDLTAAQLHANIQLITYLHKKHPSITHILGHYQQIYAKNTGLWREDLPDYYADKIDPGPTFMRNLRTALSPLGLKFFQE